MCRNIRTLYNFEPPATEDEVRASALQYVRKISGFTKPSQANAEAFERAVDAVADASRQLLGDLVTNARPKDREVEAAKRRARAAEIGSLRKMLAKFSQEEVRTHIDEYSEINIKFHQRILELSKCALLKQIADGLFLHMRAIRARTMAEGDRANRSIVDHAHIIEALEARDADLAERLVREHTLNLHDHVQRAWIEPDGSRKQQAG